MPKRKKEGTSNLIGHNIIRIRKEQGMDQQTLLAQLQVFGIDISKSSLSRLEGKQRAATDAEVKALAEIFQIPMEQLFTP